MTRPRLNITFYFFILLSLLTLGLWTSIATAESAAAKVTDEEIENLNKMITPEPTPNP